MGWWNTNEDGHSLLPECTGMFWGDGPADILDAALQDIKAQFLEATGRPPRLEELLAGIRFSHRTEGQEG